MSDRLKRDLTPSQKERDLAIVGHIADYFRGQTVGPKILQSKNNIKVFFYPAPNSSDIATLAEDLCIDITKFNGVEKRVVLDGDANQGKPSLKERFNKNLSAIYAKALAAKEFPGCDIWDFFSNKQVDAQCMREGFRNILIILTDGYLFDEKHKVQHGDSLSWVTASSLKNPNTALIVNRKGLDNLEVRILEVNPTDINHRDKLVSVLENWLKGMGVKEENITVSQTDLPSNTQTIVDSFLN
ncbi:MAG: hypothetical protein IJ647_01155 [Prevotella sp.]|nr:hypothetical protein [Prevotella sp.]